MPPRRVAVAATTECKGLGVRLTINSTVNWKRSNFIRLLVSRSATGGKDRNPLDPKTRRSPSNEGKHRPSKIRSCPLSRCHAGNRSEFPATWPKFGPRQLPCTVRVSSPLKRISGFSLRPTMARASFLCAIMPTRRRSRYFLASRDDR